ncbi:hypothetical protein [Saccharothrix obliqua]|uniref:hypothetical protein n=1 Tax=Saccharothrix obliqua TaxID=2861747 RepID=UPI001C5E0B08|nr:hypothetical protein [Saccharothrix obliqua]MBW4718349.1 hypothetical protein [Saccharothrix obliqua]
MGSDWTWTLVLPGGVLRSAAVERVLAIAGAVGLSPWRPGGGINGFDTAPGREGEHRVVDWARMVDGLVTGTWSTNLWTRSEVDIWFSVKPGGPQDTVTMSLNSCHSWREPVAEAQPFRDLHRLLTELWVSIAGEFGAVFGRVEDEWSWEQIWAGLDDPYSYDVPPPPGSWPEWLSWTTYFGADRYRRLPPLPMGPSVREMPDGAAVIALLDDPADVDPVRFARLHHAFRQALGPTTT